jgi:hypothetical protein
VKLPKELLEIRMSSLLGIGYLSFPSCATSTRHARASIHQAFLIRARPLSTLELALRVQGKMQPGQSFPSSDPSVLRIRVRRVHACVALEIRAAAGNSDGYFDLYEV